MDDPHFGWSDPIGKLVAFRIVIKHLLSRTDNFRVRMTKATYPLVGMQPDEFPERLRRIATRVLAVRGDVAKPYLTDTLWHFERLTLKQRKAFIGDIVKLYEALLVDLGQMGPHVREIVFPKDDDD